MANPATTNLEPWVVELSHISDAQERKSFLERNPQLRSREAIDSLYNAVVLLGRVDLQRAERLAEAATALAPGLSDPYATAQTERINGHVLYLGGKHREAIPRYEKALAIFEALDRDVDVARTINGALLQSLSYDGQYGRVFLLEKKARAIFQARGDQLRLGRLDINMGNVLYRQDRFQEALEYYERAYQGLLIHGEPLDIALILRNMEVCYISLNDFEKAESTHALTLKHCEQHELPLLIVEADYNIAYLYYLRGEYLRAIELYDKTRARCERLGEKYHRALCDLDESEIYLELNLTEGGEDLAHRAFLAFNELGLRYEAAKAAAFSAVAQSQQGNSRRALEIFDEARALFVEEQNQLWPPLIDLYKSLVLYEAGRDDEAHELAASALDYFGSSPLQAKAAICELLLADIELRFSDAEAARRYCSSALARLLGVESPAAYQAYFMLGRVEEASRNLELARQAYEQSYRKLEDLRSHLGRDELKIAFLKDKLAVYEGLVVTSLALDGGITGSARAFEYVEQAKSRSLADLIAFRSSSLESRAAGHPAAMEQLHELRQKLNWVNHQIELEELNPGARSRKRIENLREQGREFEDALMKAFSQVQSEDRELVGMQNATGTVTALELQSKLPDDSILVEYYSARNWFYACLVTRTGTRVFPVAEIGPVREELRMLQLQLAKFRLGEEYIKPLRRILLEATDYHLRNLHSLLIAPIRAGLNARHLIIVPHSFLHYLPFHALTDGERALIDDFTISYAPSASVFVLCQEKAPVSSGKSLVLAVPDERAPYIRDEALHVASALGGARLFLGEEATEQQLRTHGPDSQFIHIATHGYFRQDNPMFSSIRLGSSLLSLFDIYQLRLNAEMVTLSGCGTGMNVVIGGDELIGLVRGLLFAGAQTLMVSLWEVHDQSTAEFMQDFYLAYARVRNKAEALREAVLKLRGRQPHPYYWAAFALVGKFS
ncbi:MAG: CHAT domain-containing protein [Acidobacteriia bacterium]|nr:CHAT domain-containing protein [Terriglobia bacterium]